MNTQTVLYAFGLTLLAGLCTGIGSAFAFFSQRTNTRFLSVSLGFSAGVMIYVSFWEIVVKANEALTVELGDTKAQWVTVLSFFGGIALIALIDKFVPSHENPHEMHPIDEINGEQTDLPPDKLRDYNKLHRMGLLAALAIAIHNFPEGLATFTAALTDPGLGIAIAAAIAVHNIPEGIAVSIPLYYATGNRKKAFFYSFLSGLSEPVGAIVGYLILMPFFTPVVFGILFAGVGGIMVFISFDQLLPAAEEYGEHHLSIYGLIAGMAVMALSLLLFL